MDDVDSRDFDTQDFGSEELDELIIYGDQSAITPDDSPIPFDDGGASSTSVSHAPLNLDGTKSPEKVDYTAPAKPLKKRPQQPIVSTAERITGVKTFFTKLHPGAMEFLDEQICNWLKAHPNLTVKRTNTATGNIVGKMTEPNIIITIWY